MVETTVLAISAIDPVNGAGFTLDLALLQRHGFKAIGVPTGILPQSPEGVFDSYFFPGEILLRALFPLLEMKPAGVKVSIMGNLIDYIGDILSQIKGPKILDPIIWAGGKSVAQSGEVSRIIPLFDIVTPNIVEAQEILKEKSSPRELCIKFYQRFKVPTLLKGGHSAEKIDFLCWEEGLEEFFPRKIFPYEVHGTGCFLSSEILGFLLEGYSLKEAVLRARESLFRAYEKAIILGKGKRILVV